MHVISHLNVKWGHQSECDVREGLKRQTAWQQSSRGAQTDPGRIPSFKNRPVMTDSLHRQVSRLSEPGLCTSSSKKQAMEAVSLCLNNTFILFFCF